MLLHRDLKPANVLVDAQWVAKVADFGTATLEEAAADETASGAPDEGINGTPPYMAPEILTGRRYEPPVDVWAYGCVLAHMGSGRVPYSQLGLTKAAALFDVIRDGAHSPLAVLHTSRAGTPATILELATLCCLRDPAMRPDFPTLAERLKGMAPGDGESIPRPLARIRERTVIGGGTDRGGGARQRFKDRAAALSAEGVEMAEVPACMHTFDARSSNSRNGAVAFCSSIGAWTGGQTPSAIGSQVTTTTVSVCGIHM